MARSRRLLAWLVAALWALAPRGARALEVPPIGGHMTDPLGRLDSESKTRIESELTKVQEDTHIDFAGWITDAPAEQGDALGNEAFRRWNIGRDWDNGLFLLFPREGRVHIIQNPANPALPRPEVERLARVDVPTDPLARRIDRLIAEGRTLLIPKTQKKARPWGTNRPERGRAYLALTLLVAAAGSALSIRRARAERASAAQ